MQYRGSDQGPGSARPVLIRMPLTPSFSLLVFRMGILLMSALWGSEVVRTKWLLPEVSLELRTLSRQVTVTFIPAEALTVFFGILAFLPIPVYISPLNFLSYFNSQVLCPHALTRV